MDKNIDVCDPQFFFEDIEKFDHHIEKTEELYEEVHKHMKEATSVSGIKYNARSGIGVNSEISELGKTLSQIRSTGIDATYKRSQTKKAAADVFLKSRDQEMNNNKSNEVAREFLELIHDNLKSQVQPQKTVKRSEQSQLEDRVNRKLKRGEIQLTQNDKAMKYDFNGVSYGLSMKDKETIVVRDHDGNIIPDYPKERIPKMSLVKVEDGQATMDTGVVLPLED